MSHALPTALSKRDRQLEKQRRGARKGQRRRLIARFDWSHLIPSLLADPAPIERRTAAGLAGEVARAIHDKLVQEGHPERAARLAASHLVLAEGAAKPLKGKWALSSLYEGLRRGGVCPHVVQIEGKLTKSAAAVERGPCQCNLPARATQAPGLSRSEAKRWARCALPAAEREDLWSRAADDMLTPAEHQQAGQQCEWPALESAVVVPEHTVAGWLVQTGERRCHRCQHLCSDLCEHAPQLGFAVCPCGERDHAWCEQCIQIHLGIDFEQLKRQPHSWECPVCADRCDCPDCATLRAEPGSCRRKVDLGKLRRAPNSSRYHGVRQKSNGRFRASYLNSKQQRVGIGVYDSAEEAAVAAGQKALILEDNQAREQSYQCEKDMDCVLLKGHPGPCQLRPPLSQCTVHSRKQVGTGQRFLVSCMLCGWGGQQGVWAGLDQLRDHYLQLGPDSCLPLDQLRARCPEFLTKINAMSSQASRRSQSRPRKRLKQDPAAVPPGPAQPPAEINLAAWQSSRNKTGFQYVYELRDGRFEAQFQPRFGAREFLGKYRTAELAATAHAKRWLQEYGQPPKPELPGHPTISSQEDGARQEPMDLSPWRCNRSKTGFVGVYKHEGKFQAQTIYRGKRLYLGTRSTAEQAAGLIARKWAEFGHGAPQNGRVQAKRKTRVMAAVEQLSDEAGQMLVEQYDQLVSSQQVDRVRHSIKQLQIEYGLPKNLRMSKIVSKLKAKLFEG